MAKFNLYKISPTQKDSLTAKLDDVGLKKISTKVVERFNLDFYFSNKPDEIDIWWTGTYKNFFGDIEPPKNKIYFAVLLIYNTDIIYAVSLGKSHFYLKKFSELDFGLNLAERIADDSNHKIKNSKFYKSRKNKVITTYHEGGGIEYESGESMHYLKARTIDEEGWGKTASFGHSAQFNVDISAEDLPAFIQKIEGTLVQPPRFKLPKVIAVSDEKTIEELDNLLADVILQRGENSAFQESDVSLSGVDFIFSDQYEYNFYVKGLRGVQSDKIELTLENLRNFLLQNNIDLKQNLDEIKIKIYNEYGRDFSISLKEALDFVEEENRFCLIDGRWYQFNQSYVDFLKDEVDSIEFQEQEEVLDQTEDGFNRGKEEGGFINCDKVLEGIPLETRTKYKVEKLDLYKDGAMYFVKFGTPKKMNYVVDQAINTVRLLQNNQSKLLINGEEKQVETICLWLVFIGRKKKVQKLSDLNSLILHMKLADWKRAVQNARYKPMVYVSYKRDE